jgi:hypothetical protein
MVAMLGSTNDNGRFLRRRSVVSFPRGGILLSLLRDGQ